MSDHTLCDADTTETEPVAEEASGDSERDMVAPADKLNDEEDRLVTLETQTRLLADAVVAIAGIDDTPGPAVRATQDETHEHRRTTDVQPDLPSGRRATDRVPNAPLLPALDVAALREMASKVRGPDQPD